MMSSVILSNVHYVVSMCLNTLRCMRVWVINHTKRIIVTLPTFICSHSHNGHTAVCRDISQIRKNVHVSMAMSTLCVIINKLIVLVLKWCIGHLQIGKWALRFGQYSTFIYHIDGYAKRLMSSATSFFAHHITISNWFPTLLLICITILFIDIVS